MKNKQKQTTYSTVRKVSLRSDRAAAVLAVAGIKSRASILAQRRQGSIGTGSGLTPYPQPKPNNPQPVPQPAPVPQPVPPAATANIQVGQPGSNAPIVLQLPPSTHSKAAEFDKGGRRSSSDYTTFSNKEQWPKWQRQLIGTAYEHKTELVLDSTYAPDPNDQDEVDLFNSMQRFMYSVFTKVLTEPSAVDILRKYSDPTSPIFGDSQGIYADLCDRYEGGALACVTVTELETKLTTMRLNRDWNKSVTSFVNLISSMIKDHKELTHSIHQDEYYIEKVNASLSEHKDMSQHVQTLQIQDGILARKMGSACLPTTYEGHIHEIKEYATILDARYAKNPRNQRANRAEGQTAVPAWTYIILPQVPF